jgi:hypothetical protein
MRQRTFRETLQQNRHRHDAIGDFCRDALSDPGFQRRITCWDRLERYLQDQSAIDRAIEAARRCFGLYERTTSRGPAA